MRYKMIYMSVGIEKITTVDARKIFTVMMKKIGRMAMVIVFTGIVLLIVAMKSGKEGEMRKNTTREKIALRIVTRLHVDMTDARTSTS